MKVGDSVILREDDIDLWNRVGLVLGFKSSAYEEHDYLRGLHDGIVVVFWGEDFPYEEEYFEQLEVIV